MDRDSGIGEERSRGRRRLLKTLAALGGGSAGLLLRIDKWKSPVVEVGLLPASATGMTAAFHNILRGRFRLNQTGSSDHDGIMERIDPSGTYVNSNTTQVVSSPTSSVSGYTRLTAPGHQPYNGSYSNSGAFMGGFQAETAPYEIAQLGPVTGFVQGHLVDSSSFAGWFGVRTMDHRYAYWDYTASRV